MPKRESHVTIDHDEIRRWAEARQGTPAMVSGTRTDGRGMIRLDFPGYSGAGKLEPMSWEEWFQNFDQNQLALVYEETTSRGQQSSFNKLIGRETVDLSTGRVKGPPRRRVKQGARTVREARQLRAGRVGTARKKPARRAAAEARKAQAKAKPSTRRTSAKAAIGRTTTRGAKRKETTGRGSRRVRQQAAGRTARTPRKRPRK